MTCISYKCIDHGSCFIGGLFYSMLVPQRIRTLQVMPLHYLYVIFPWKYIKMCVCHLLAILYQSIGLYYPFTNFLVCIICLLPQLLRQYLVYQLLPAIRTRMYSRVYQRPACALDQPHTCVKLQ